MKNIQGFENLLIALKRRGIQIVEINNQTVSIRVGAGVFLCRNMIKKRIKRKDGVKYEKTVDPCKYGFTLEDAKGLIVLIKPSEKTLT